MELVSTRDAQKRVHSYCEVLLQGLAEDGGLYTPLAFPEIKHEDLIAMRTQSYAQVAFTIKHMLCGDSIPEDILRAMVDKTYTPDVFVSPLNDIVPINEIGNKLFKANVSCGPTASFKDMAMQLLGREMEYALAIEKKSLAILGATSGDTGSAAEAALRGRKGIALCMLSPKEGMSDFQRAQMGALTGLNIRNISVKGRFDDCQDLVKELKREPEFADLGAVNSINFARISSQVAYYVYIYAHTVSTIGDPLDVAVPSGNFGNALAAYFARKMGVPIRRIVVATNENDVLDHLIKTGIYAQKTANITSSPSMDISKASNYERLAYYLLRQDPEAVVRYMSTFDATGSVDVADFGIDRTIFAKENIVSGASSHSERLRTIESTYQTSGHVIDPHTADAVTIAKQYLDPQENIPMVCIETALPVKFEATIAEALGHVPPRPERFEHVEESYSDDQFITIDTKSASLRPIVREMIRELQ